MYYPGLRTPFTNHRNDRKNRPRAICLCAGETSTVVRAAGFRPRSVCLNFLELDDSARAMNCSGSKIGIRFARMEAAPPGELLRTNTLGGPPARARIAWHGRWGVFARVKSPKIVLLLRID